MQNFQACQGHGYHIHKNAFVYTFEPQIWDYSIPVLIHIQNMCGKAVLIGPIPILVEVIYGGSALTPL